MSKRGETILAIVAVALFFLVRLALLVVREPFFDELFTVWMARQPFGAIVPALLSDSGPPLYYFVARIADVTALRVLSLLFATGTLALVLTRKSLGDARYVAALLLALHPPSALFAVDARAYALCALFVAAGTIAVHERRAGWAAGAFLLAACTHWYGALFLPLVLLVRPRRRSGVAFAVACVLFAPGLWLASRQPVAATGWLAEQNPLAALGAFAFAGRYADALFVSLPLIVIAVSFLAVLAAGARKWTFLPMALVPVVLAIAFGVAGRTVYFPMRFESVIAVPLVLWLATSLAAWTRTERLVLTAILCACGMASLAMGVADHVRRPADDYREAVDVLARYSRTEPVVASGYLYLEAVHRLGAERVTAYPAEQGRHPGWRVVQASHEPLPEGAFVWIGERTAPELEALVERGRVVVFDNERTLIVRVEGRPHRASSAAE